MERDYLAIIFIMSGGSWARDKDKDKAIKRVKRLYKSDWSSLFKLKGTKAIVNVFDVTGHDNVHWDHAGIWDSDTNTKLPDTCLVTRITYTV